MRMAGAAAAARASGRGDWRRPRVARGVGGGNAEKLGELPPAALFASRLLAGADEQFLFALTIAADKFVERHGSGRVSGEW